MPVLAAQLASDLASQVAASCAAGAGECQDTASDGGWIWIVLGVLAIVGGIIAWRVGARRPLRRGHHDDRQTWISNAGDGPTDSD
jgi:hypothetical protein